MLEDTDGVLRPLLEGGDEATHQRPLGAVSSLLPPASADVPTHLMTSSHSKAIGRMGGWVVNGYGWIRKQSSRCERVNV